MIPESRRGALALLFFFALCAFEGASPAIAAEGDPAAGKRKTLTCNACHGNSGFKSMPKLGGQSAAYVVEALRAFKAGKRSHATMRDVAGSLSERDMADLGAHYASLPRTELVEGPSPEAAGICKTCHGPHGDQPLNPGVPILAGQSAAYMEQVLREYRNGSGRVNEIMQGIAKSLTDDQIGEISAWFAQRSGLTAK